MTSASNNSGICSYTYADNGLLKTRQTPLATTSIERDNVGRVMGERMNNNAGSLLFNESMQYQLNGQLKNYSVLDNGLGVPTEDRAYVYDQCGRVVQEPYLFNGQQTAQYFFDGSPLGTLNSTTDGLGIRTLQFVNSTTFNGVMAQNSFLQSTNDKVCMMPQYNGSYPWSLSYDELGEITSRSPGIFTQSFTWDSFGCLAKIAQKGNNSDYTWSTIYDGLGRRIQTGLQGNTSGNSSTINYYYDPEVEFLELGHDNNGRTWNLYGPDRSGTYGGAQGIGGLEVTWQLSGDVINGILNNYFGDSLGTINSSGTPTPYNGVLGSYGPMPGSSVSQNLTPQWRGHYIDETGFYYMGARYYEPNSGRFLSADPLGHDASLSLYDYCNGDPVNALDADGRCGTGMAKGYTMGTFASYDNIPQMLGGVVGTIGSYTTPVVAEGAIIRDIGGALYHVGSAGLDMLNNGVNWQNGTQMVLSGVGACLGFGGVAGSFAQASEMTMNEMVAADAAEGFNVLRVRHYTSSEGLQGIQDSGEIRIARGNPTGVHVEVGPDFGPASTGASETGAARSGISGAFIEFNAPEQMSKTIVGPRNTAIIPRASSLPINNLNPTFVKWWQFWKY